MSGLLLIDFHEGKIVARQSRHPGGGIITRASRLAIRAFQAVKLNPLNSAFDSPAALDLTRERGLPHCLPSFPSFLPFAADWGLPSAERITTAEHTIKRHKWQ